MKNLVIFKNIIGIAGLGYLSVEDIRRQELSTISILGMGILGVGLSLAQGGWSMSGVLQLLPGLLVLLLSHISRESIGRGDGLVILCLGGYLPLPQLVQLCMLAFTLAGIAALVLLVMLRKGRGMSMPFVPFLLAGYVLTLLGGM